VLKDFMLKVLQVYAETADATACRLEHGIDAASMDRLVRFIEYIYQCPRTGTQWLQSFLEHCSADKLDWEKCGRCLDECKARHQNSRNG
jgi:DtxR family Mn-dependent transcriptional regulator